MPNFESRNCHSNCLRKDASCCWTSESSRRSCATSSSSLVRRSGVVEVGPVVRAAGKSARATLTLDASGWPEKRWVYLDSFVPGWRGRIAASGGTLVYWLTKLETTYQCALK